MCCKCNNREMLLPLTIFLSVYGIYLERCELLTITGCVVRAEYESLVTYTCVRALCTAHAHLLASQLLATILVPEYTT